MMPVATIIRLPSCIINRLSSAGDVGFSREVAVRSFELIYVSLRV
jgi:hypothetical protein